MCSVATFVLLGMPVFAAELHIDSQGKFHMDSANVVSTNNNFVLVEVWGTKWSIFIDAYTKIRSAGDLELTTNAFAVGHALTVDGTFNKDNKVIEATLIVDESVGTPKPKEVSPPPPVAISASPKPSVSAAPAILKQPIDAKDIREIRSYLKLSSEGPEVLKLQQFLISNGFLAPDNATGYFGLVTSSAVKRFQFANGLAGTGTVGPLTRAVLNSLLGSDGTVAGASTSVPTDAQKTAGITGTITQYLRYQSKHPEVLILQNFLVDQGFLSADNATGYFGDATWDAVVAFQKANGLEYKYGAVGPQTRDVINGMLAGQ